MNENSTPREATAEQIAMLAQVKGFNVVLDGSNVTLGWSIWLRSLDGSGTVQAFEGDDPSGFMIRARAEAERKARAFLAGEPNRLYL